MPEPHDSVTSVASRPPSRPLELERPAPESRGPSPGPAAPERELVPAVCPYCGESTDHLSHAEPAVGTPRCRACLAFLDRLSKQVTHGHMGPWFVRDTTRPFYPGVAFDVLTVLIGRGEITRDTVIRGPGSGQFWMRAGTTPGVAHLLGICHACGAESPKGSRQCAACGTRYPSFHDRDRLGIAGAQAAERLSAFATDAELREGAPAPAAPRTPAPAQVFTPGSLVPRPAGERLHTPLEVSLSEEVAGERRKTLWLMVAIGLLLVVNLGIAAWALMGMRHGAGPS